MKRSCGGCTMCCKVMGVGDLRPDPKPQDVWCDYCRKGRGCAIYAARPETCRTFECVWLQDRHGLFDENCRPDKTGVVMVASDDGCGLIAFCDVARPTAWRDPRILSRLRACAKADYPAGARAGKRMWVIGRTGEWEAPEECIKRGPNGKVSVFIPNSVKREIGLTVSPELVERGVYENFSN